MGGSGSLPASALWFIGAVGVVIALLGVVPVYLEASRERSWREKLLSKVKDENDPNLNEQLLSAAAEPAEVRGFTRGLIALLIVALIGLGLAAAMVMPSADAGDVRKNIITALTTVLATLAGFYFGSRTSQTSAEDARRRRESADALDSARQSPGAQGSGIQGSGTAADSAARSGDKGA